MPIEFSSTVDDVELGRSNFFSSGAIDLNGMDRDQLTIDKFQPVSQNSSLTGFDGATFSTTAATVIDMSSALSVYDTFGGLPPKGYVVSVNAQDSGSAAATTCRFRLRTSSSVNTNRAMWLGLEGVTDSKYRNISGFIEADANGDITYDLNASGSSTMTVYMQVHAMVF